MTSRLNIRLDLPLGHCRLWHRDLIGCLGKAGHDVTVNSVPAEIHRRWSATLQSWLDSVLHPPDPRSPTASWTPDSVPRRTSGVPDLIIGLAGWASDTESIRRLEPVCGQGNTEQHVLVELLAGLAPVIGVRDSLAPGRPFLTEIAYEAPLQLRRSLDNFAIKLGALLLKAVARAASGSVLPGPDIPAGLEILRPSPQSWTWLMQRARSAALRLKGPRPQDHWHVAWRKRRSGLPDIQPDEWDGSRWQFLPDKPGCYFADPFLFEQAGKTWLFVEEYVHALGRAHISVVELDGLLPLDPPRPCLSPGYHLSYPQVFSLHGEIWMIPESSAAARLELFRAKRFPFEWERAAILFEDVRIADATLLRHKGAFWLFGSQRAPFESDWDTLSIWYADALEGLWIAHEQNPVVISASGARQAGAFQRHEGQIFRIAQDCRGHYGAGLAISTVDGLTANTFAETKRPILRPPAESRWKGLHTWNTAAGIEAFDLLRR